MSSQTLPRRVAEFLPWEVDAGFCRESSKITNNTGAPITLTADQLLGMPLKLVAGVWEFALNADVAGVHGLILNGDIVTALADAGVTPRVYGILALGPARIIEDYLQADDPAGTTWTLATLKTSIEALGIKIQTLGSEYSQQST